MTVAHQLLITMYGHANWANRRLLDQAAQLTREQLDAPLEGGYGTPRETLAHMLIAQTSWLRRFQELEPVKPRETSDFPDIAALRAAWDELNAETTAYVAGLTDDDLAEVITYKSWAGWQATGPRWQTLLHQAFHQHQHRGEVAMALTQAGHSPGDLDILDYLEESGSVAIVDG
jgi:uncharacterized damage-inducible protein DinB